MNAFHDPTGRARAFTLAVVLQFALKLLTLFGLALLSAPLWPLYGLGTLIWYRPPNVPRLTQAMRYLKLAWTVDPPTPGLPAWARLWISLKIVQKVLLTPVLGLVWLIDELLYGPALDATPVVAPLFVVSAARSGSTQIALYLDDDPALAAPNILQSMFPYLWLWRLAPRTVGRLLDKDQIRAKIRSMMPPELLERHEGDPFHIDTFDGAFYSAHLNSMAFDLGPDAVVAEFNFARFAPHNRRLWEEDFITFVDRIARKTLLHAGPTPDGAGKRFLLKGHFLCGADALARQYPDARFLTVIRDPALRLRSAINYMRVNPSDPVLGPIPWPWLASALARTEREYCQVEQAWFTRETGPRRCVIRFSEFVHDLETTMRRVYRTCCDADALPSHVPTQHAPRERTHYTVNRTLAELGIDQAELRAQLASYVAWCRAETPPRSTTTAPHSTA
jgi:hypothetical protein